RMLRGCYAQGAAERNTTIGAPRQWSRGPSCFVLNVCISCAVQPKSRGAPIMAHHDENFEGTVFMSADRLVDLDSTKETIGHYLIPIGRTRQGKPTEVSTEPITIGRSPHQTLAFADDAQLSRQHARVSLVNGEVVAEDLKSTNGTFVDAKRITGSTTLKAG